MINDFYLEYIKAGLGLYAICLAGVAAVLVGLYSHLRRYDNLSYSIILAGFSIIYLACYRIYILSHLSHPQNFVISMLVVSVLALVVAVKQQGQLLAAMAIFVSVSLPSLLLEMFCKQPLAIYLILILAFVLLFSYLTGWLMLNAVSVLGYLLYNPLLFQTTTIEPKGGLLSVNELIWIFGSVFGVFTIIPLIFTIVSKKQRLFESLSITLAGAYTFTMAQFVIEHHMQWINELPFFLKIFVRDIPTMENLHLQMFFIYSLVYGLLLMFVICIDRRAKIVIATLANLCCLSLFGLLYVHSFTAELIDYLVWAHNLVIDMLV